MSPRAPAATAASAYRPHPGAPGGTRRHLPNPALQPEPCRALSHSLALLGTVTRVAGRVEGICSDLGGGPRLSLPAEGSGEEEDRVLSRLHL